MALSEYQYGCGTNIHSREALSPRAVTPFTPLGKLLQPEGFNMFGQGSTEMHPAEPALHATLPARAEKVTQCCIR